MSKPLDVLRRETLVTLDEIKAAESSLRSSGIDVRDENEWEELAEIIARIERKLGTNPPQRPVTVVTAVSGKTPPTAQPVLSANPEDTNPFEE
jgi:hypothetical protein